MDKDLEHSESSAREFEVGMFDPKKRLEYVAKSYHNDELDLQYYERALGIKMAELEGKRVLDIGGAPNGLFTKESSKYEFDLTTLNPETAPGWRRRLAWNFDLRHMDKSAKPPKTVGGLVQEMPFKKNFFDFVISVGAIPINLPAYESEYRQSFKEILNVLREGGKAIFFPILEEMKNDEAFQKILLEMQDKCEFKFEYAPSFEQEIEGEKIKPYRLILIKKQRAELRH